jgi:signal transduction histidine kinase
MSLEAAAIAYNTAQLMRHIAEAPTLAQAFAEIDIFAQRCFPADARLDLLDESAGRHVLLYSGTPADPPPAAGSAHALVQWLSARGYQAISTIPLSASAQRHGWLVLARLYDRLEAEHLSLAGQLAAIIALRIQSEQLREANERHEAELAALDQRLHLQDEVRLWATLAAGAAHDIGNLFASVMGHVQLLQQTAPESIQSDLQVIEQAARDGNFLLRRLLSSRLPQVENHAHGPTLLPQVAHEALQLTEPLWAHRGRIQIDTQLEPVAPVPMHAAELREVLINLILNGIAAMPEGGTITMRTRTCGQMGLIEVQDTGIGIAPAQQSAIFQPAASSREGGSGLGLSVSRALIESYGGTMEVSSQPGKGATFTVMLPL